MDATFQVVSPSNAVLVMPGVLGNERSAGKFMLFVGSNVNRYTTPPFQVPGLRISLRLKIMRNMNSTNRLMTIQFLLSDPEDDVIVVNVNEHKAIMTASTSDSFLFQEQATDKLYVAPSVRYCSEASVVPQAVYHFALIRHSGECLLLPENAVEAKVGTDVKILVDEKEIPATRELLSAHSHVFKAMFDHDTKERQTGVIKITDFPFDVVREMVHFMRHGYCGLWHKEWNKLSAIADKYDIIAMKERAVEKKQLLDQIS